jgi:hypothetical protein
MHDYTTSATINFTDHYNHLDVFDISD